jgi:hypothetical protein
MGVAPSSRISARLLSPSGAPHRDAGLPPQSQKRLTDRAGGTLHEHALAALHAGRPVQKLVLLSQKAAG